MGMAQLGHRLALSLEAGREFGVASEMGIQQLKRHILVQGAVTGPIHQPHPAAGDVAYDFVGADERPRHKRLIGADGICWICHWMRVPGPRLNEYIAIMRDWPIDKLTSSNYYCSALKTQSIEYVQHSSREVEGPAR